MKNHWLIVNIPRNSCCESALKFSKTNLTKLYRARNIAEIFPGEYILCLICLQKTLTTMTKLTAPSRKADKRLVFILTAVSIAG